MHETRATSSSEAMAASSPPIREEEEDSEADDAIELDGGADFVRLAPQSDAEEEGVAHWAFRVQWDEEMRAGATIKVPATEGLSKEELTIDLDKDVPDPSKRPPGSRGTTVQFTVALPLLPDGASFFAVEGVKLLPAPEEVVPDGMWRVDRVLDVRTKAKTGKISEVFVRWEGFDEHGKPWPDEWKPAREVTPEILREAGDILKRRAAGAQDEEDALPAIEQRQRKNVQEQQEQLRKLGLDSKTLGKQRMKKTPDGKFSKPPGPVPKGKRWNAEVGEWVMDKVPNAECEVEAEQVERARTEVLGPDARNIVATQVEVVAEAWDRARTASGQLEPSAITVRDAQTIHDEMVAQLAAAETNAAAATAARHRIAQAVEQAEPKTAAELAADNRKRGCDSTEPATAAMRGLSLATDVRQSRQRTTPTRYQAGEGGGLARPSSSQSSQSQPSYDQQADGGIDNATALDVTGFCVGDLILAKGFSPTGERKWFQAKVTNLRTVYPPIVIKYIATEEGSTQLLLLPSPRTAYVHRGDTRKLSTSEC